MRCLFGFRFNFQFKFVAICCQKKTPKIKTFSRLFPFFPPAMVVRFITKRFIGDYDPSLERVYNYTTTIDNETVNFEILDSAGQMVSFAI